MGCMRDRLYSFPYDVANNGLQEATYTREIYFIL